MHKLKVVAALLTLTLLTACAGHPKTTLSRHAIKRIAIIPATNPRSFSFENASPPVGYPFQFWVNKADSKNKAEIFNGKMNLPPMTLGSDLTAQVAAALRGYGFTVDILEGLARPNDDPDDVDYEKLSANADAILHLRISEVGMYSSRLSVNYIPRLNASGKLFEQGRDDNVYDEDIYYGVDAKKGKAWAIVPNAKFSYRWFDDVMADIDGVRSAFAIGVQEISLRMSEQLSNAAKAYGTEAPAPTGAQ
jgi:hypothetical protein